MHCHEIRTGFNSRRLHHVFQLKLRNVLYLLKPQIVASAGKNWSGLLQKKRSRLGLRYACTKD
jgi:hypothetical protein